MIPAVLDANIILRYLLEDDETLAEKANGIIERIRSRQLTVHICGPVIVECVFVLQKSHKVPRDLIASRLTAILCLSGVVNTDRDELVTALSIYNKSNLSIVDSMLLTMVRRDRGELLTFDDQLAKHAERSRH